MNKSLASKAKEALTADWSASGDGWCQRWTRQTLEKVYGSKYAGYMESSAAKTGRAFLNAGLGFRRSELKSRGGLQLSDILYKLHGSGSFGHVGIYIGNNQVAENSSFHGSRDARGTRTLAQWGTVDVIVRLPEPNTIAATGNVSGQEKPVRYFLETPLGETELKGAQIVEQRLVANVADVAQACGFKLTVRNDQTDTDGKYYIRAEVL